MKKLIESIDQKCDDYVVRFHKSLINLFLLQAICIIAILGTAVSPVMLFQKDTWMKIVGGIVLLLSPICTLIGFFITKNAGWHFHNTLENRMRK